MWKRIVVASILLLFISFYCGRVLAYNCEQESNISKRIECLTQVTKDLNQQANTLSTQIQYLNSQITLTLLKIQQTEENIQKIQSEIELLTTKIKEQDNLLNIYTKKLIDRIIDGYKKRSVSIFNIVLDSDNAFNFLNNLKYAKAVQEYNRNLTFVVQTQKTNSEEQKKIREEKKKQLDSLMVTLAAQKQDLNTQQLVKKRLLEETQNSELVYQQLLQQAQSEYAAIQGIISGGGVETEVRDVKKGDTIASLLSGKSCNSSGTHLHFIVIDNGTINNPFNYLKSVDIENCSGSGCPSGDGDSVNPSGSWDWPLDPKIEVYQGYGPTWAILHTWVGQIYSFHNGIDILGTSDNVKAVADGTLYKGGYSGSGGCLLPYVMLKHKDSNMITYYLHVYSQ